MHFLARVHVDALIGSRQREHPFTCQKCRRSRDEERFDSSGTSLHISLSCPFSTYLLQETARQTECATRWLQLNVEAKTKIKQDALITLGSSSQKAGNFASQVVAAIAGVELPQGQWQDLIEILLRFVNTADNVNLRIATLQTIGYICEVIVSPAVRGWMRSYI